MKDIIKKAKLGGHYERTTLVYDIHLNWLMDYVTNLGNGKMVECGVARGGCIALCHIANPDLQIILIVGEKDTSWKSKAIRAHQKLQAIQTKVSLDIIPNEGHIMNNFAGIRFITLINKRIGIR